MQVSKRTDIQRFDGTQELQIAIYRLAKMVDGKPFDRLVYRDDLEYASDKDNPDVTSLRAGLVPVVNGKEVPLLALGTYAITTPFVDSYVSEGETEQLDATDDFHRESMELAMDNLGAEGYGVKTHCDALVERFKEGGTFKCLYYHYQYTDKNGVVRTDGKGVLIGFNHK